MYSNSLRNNDREAIFGLQNSSLAYHFKISFKRTLIDDKQTQIDWWILFHLTYKSKKWKSEDGQQILHFKKE